MQVEPNQENQEQTRFDTPNCGCLKPNCSDSITGRIHGKRLTETPLRISAGSSVQVFCVVWPDSYSHRSYLAALCADGQTQNCGVGPNQHQIDHEFPTAGIIRWSHLAAEGSQPLDVGLKVLGAFFFYLLLRISKPLAMIKKANCLGGDYTHFVLPPVTISSPENSGGTDITLETANQVPTEFGIGRNTLACGLIEVGLEITGLTASNHVNSTVYTNSIDSIKHGFPSSVDTETGTHANYVDHTDPNSYRVAYNLSYENTLDHNLTIDSLNIYVATSTGKRLLRTVQVTPQGQTPSMDHLLIESEQSRVRFSIAMSGLFQNVAEGFDSILGDSSTIDMIFELSATRLNGQRITSSLFQHQFKRLYDFKKLGVPKDSGTISMYGSYALYSLVREAQREFAGDPWAPLCNDGSKPFGGSFSPDHAEHKDGLHLDMRYFGGSIAARNNYDIGYANLRRSDIDAYLTWVGACNEAGLDPKPESCPGYPASEVTRFSNWVVNQRNGLTAWNQLGWSHTILDIIISNGGKDNGFLSSSGFEHAQWQYKSIVEGRWPNDDLITHDGIPIGVCLDAWMASTRRCA